MAIIGGFLLLQFTMPTFSSESWLTRKWNNSIPFAERLQSAINLVLY